MTETTVRKVNAVFKLLLRVWSVWSWWEMMSKGISKGRALAMIQKGLASVRTDHGLRRLL